MVCMDVCAKIKRKSSIRFNSVLCNMWMRITDSVSERLSTETKLHWIGWWITEWRSRSWWDRDADVRYGWTEDMKWLTMMFRFVFFVTRNGEWYYEKQVNVFSRMHGEMTRNREYYSSVCTFFGATHKSKFAHHFNALTFNALWIHNFMDNTNGTTYLESVPFKTLPPP